MFYTNIYYKLVPKLICDNNLIWLTQLSSFALKEVPTILYLLKFRGLDPKHMSHSI